MKKIKEQIEIDALVEKAHIAEKEYEKLSQEQIDNIVKEMSIAAVEANMKLAKQDAE